MKNFKVKQVFMDLINSGYKTIELRKLDKKALQILEHFSKQCSCFYKNNILCEFSYKNQVIFEVVETGEQYEVEITECPVIMPIIVNSAFDTLDNFYGTEDYYWYDISDFSNWVTREYRRKNLFLNWLEEYYKNETAIVIYKLGKVVKL